MAGGGDLVRDRSAAQCGQYPAVVSVNASPRVWGADRLVSGLAGYSLVGEGAACDVAEFERLIEESVGE